MILRAKVDALEGDYSVRVSIPEVQEGIITVEGSPIDNLPTCSMAVPAGVYPALKVGSRIFVGFEEDNVYKPVFLGLLYNSNSKDLRADVYASSLSVDSNATLPYDTKIGQVENKEIACLKGIESNIQEQLNDLEAALKALEDRVAALEAGPCPDACTIIENLNESLTELKTGYLYDPSTPEPAQDYKKDEEDK